MHLALVLLIVLAQVSCKWAGAVANSGGEGILLKPVQLDALASSFKTQGGSSGRSSMTADMDTISVIMRTLMPSMFNLFSNITSDEYKAQFKEPCRFDALLDIFSQLPPYFDVMARKYAPRNDLVAYYSMQLASTFLVNNNSLTMTCLYNMMSLQTRLKTFSLDLMDNPEKNFHLVGLFGYFIKPVMGMLKQNAMMKIIDHVEKYENNDDLGTVAKFNVLNVIFVFAGLVAICANILLIVLLRRVKKASSKPTDSKLCTAVVVKNVATPIYKKSATRHHHHHHQPAAEPKLKTSQYKIVKSRNYYLNQFLRRKYTSRECAMLIAVCHSLYILINYIIMNQTGFAIHALKGLSQFNSACKMAFFFSPPTTAYTILHQFAIWLLVFAVRQHGRKLRFTRLRGGFENRSSLDESEETEDGSNTETQSADFYSRYEENNGALNQSLTNNSAPSHIVKPLQTLNMQKSTVHFQDHRHPSNPARFPLIPADSHRPIPYSPHQHYHEHAHNQHPVQIVSNYYQSNVFALPNNEVRNSSTLIRKTASSSSRSRHESITKKNLIFSGFLLAILLVYNAQNLLLYKLNELTTDMQTIMFCAFDDKYADYYSMLTHFLVPFLNLFLFAILPLTLLTVQVLLDTCFLIRVRREQAKRYMKLSECIEWPLYCYYLVYMISHLPYALHQLVDLAIGTSKFPFVFPLFIQMKFSAHVWLVIIEQTLIFLGQSADLFIWLVVDRQMRELCIFWLNKRILCRTYTKDLPSSSSTSETSSSASSTHSCSASKSGSDSSVIVNEESIKLQPTVTKKSNAALSRIENQSHHVDNNNGAVASAAITANNNLINRPNSYASSTMASTSSSNTATLTHKRPLPARIVDEVKASAALSAASTHRFDRNGIDGDGDGDDENHIDLGLDMNHSLSPPSAPLSSNQPVNIRMIDTDDEIDQINDNALFESTLGKTVANNGVHNFVRMSEQIDLNGIVDHGTLDKHSYSFNNYDRHPPSFKTVMLSSLDVGGANPSSQTVIKSPSSAGDSHHQYQNDEFDLDIHSSTKTTST